MKKIISSVVIIIRQGFSQISINDMRVIEAVFHTPKLHITLYNVMWRFCVRNTASMTRISLIDMVLLSVFRSSSDIHNPVFGSQTVQTCFLMCFSEIQWSKHVWILQIHMSLYKPEEPLESHYMYQRSTGCHFH